MQAEQPSGLGHNVCPLPLAGSVAIVWQLATCVLGPQSSPLGSWLPWQVVKCVFSTIGFHWMLSVTGGEIEACQSQLVDLKLVYIFRIILYD